MFRRGAFVVFTSMLLAISACSRASNNEARTENQPPAKQAAASEASPTQAQQAERVSKPEAEPARPSPVQPEQRPAAKPAPARPDQAPVSRPAAAAPAAAPAPPQGVAPVNAPPVPPQPVQPPPPPKPIIIASGTRFEVRLLSPVSSASAKSGDTFKASLDQDLESDGKVVAPRGSQLVGQLENVKPSGRVEGRATLSMKLTEITIGPTTYPIQTNTLSFEAEKSTKEDVTKVGIGAGLGAIIGAIAGGGKGAAIGAAVGGGAGTATVLATKGKEVKFGTEEKFSFVLRSDLVVKQ
jgi:hypothetical protein